MPATNPRRPIAVTIGDPAGVGSEVTGGAWTARHEFDLPPFVAIGDIAAISAVWDGPIARVSDMEEALRTFDDALPVWHLEDSGPLTPGTPTAAGATCALHALETGIGMTRTQASCALVTGPVSKFALHGIGYTHPGQTEFIAERCGVTATNAVMMLAGPGLRVVPLTVHIPLSEVPERLTTDLIVAKARVTARALRRDFGIAEPQLAIAGLNPHAGESGDLGSEEAQIIQPAIEQLQSEGIAIDGPLASDSLFAPHVRTRYDALLCCYHDQALAPFKALHFHDGVNLTLGLPIIRTSPDHGTAFNIAGKGLADPRPTIAAIALAATLAASRERNAVPAA
ncbi:4-hydroxythreonine-4-phosphate dehydrogenase PdxA [Sphingopyxis witflariensis]|uniref:4-hydroxythreonine-4-phosphate dehydrogenase n=1 Tax=Sphingopyxis witflariensis TaxID=173675 RepID=A0A246JQH3_9SPHN|nr:4-hydroxythreonine-4-phosphate dehydrogenase PdxA [Sphingopyxis witflariensis]OWQ95281.1 4-hydroxythreonine-4-phosphate dehydrogenase PdxA [Sphingopyxis witflariensis]